VSPLALAALLTLPVQQPPVFDTGVEAVYVDVFVTDGRKPVTGLTAADFELRDDGVPRPVALIATQSLPLTTFLVLDASGSVMGEKILQLRNASGALLRRLQPGERAALLTFDYEVALRVRPTSDLAPLERGLRDIAPRGGTALFDALYAGVLLASAAGRSLIVVFTDGDDNASWLDQTAVRNVLEKSNVLVQAVGIVPDGQPPHSGDAFTLNRAAEAMHVRSLRRLAEVTGGRFWPAAEPERLADAFVSILEAMRSRYILRFEPARDRPGLH
jgi:VWFA-related protein